MFAVEYFGAAVQCLLRGSCINSLRCMQSQVDGALPGHRLRLEPVLEIS